MDHMCTSGTEPSYKYEIEIHRNKKKTIHLKCLFPCDLDLRTLN